MNTTAAPVVLLWRAEQRTQEIMDLENWSKSGSVEPDVSLERVFDSVRHMNIENLICEVGLHLLYDWEGEYTPEKRRQIIRQHIDKYPDRTGPFVEGGPMEMGNCDFIDTVISELNALPQMLGSAGHGTINEFIAATFEQFEQALPKSSLENKFLAISNCNQNWKFSSKEGEGEESMPYTPQDRIEYRILNTMLVDVYSYNHEEESEEESSDEEDSDEEEGMSDEERKEMCSKGLEILESIMEKDDQRMGEGDFVNLCNLLKELHKP